MSIKQHYPIHQSPLYKLSSKKRLSELLGFEIKNFDSLVSDKNYRVFINGRGREIQHPIGALGTVHQRLAKLFSLIEVPDYVQSTKGRSYVSNARHHASNVPLIKTDVSRFYPSITFSFLYQLFHSDFKCSQDVAWHLARLCCYRGVHLPTGSQISGSAAYLARKHMFDDIHDLAKRNNCAMTCYVDDIVLSGEKAWKRLLLQVRRIIQRYGLVTKDEKSQCFASYQPKIVTGVVICGDVLRLPNKRHLQMWKTKRKLTETADKYEHAELEAALQGRVQEARQIDPNFCRCV